MTPLDKAIVRAGGVKALADFFGISVRAIYKWKVKGVPLHRCPDIEDLLHGEVRCEDLRSDVNWQVLRKNVRNK